MSARAKKGGDAFTAKNVAIQRAPSRIELLGDTARPESAQHIIEFPGGAIEVTRTTDGDYWAHIIVNQEEAFEDGSTRQSARGEILGTRVQREDGLTEIHDASSLSQVAVLIRARGAS